MRLPLFLFLMTSITACNNYSRASFEMRYDSSGNGCTDWECSCPDGFSVAGYTATKNGMGKPAAICLQD